MSTLTRQWIQQQCAMHHINASEGNNAHLLRKIRQAQKAQRAVAEHGAKRPSKRANRQPINLQHLLQCHVRVVDSQGCGYQGLLIRNRVDWSFQLMSGSKTLVSFEKDAPVKIAYQAGAYTIWI